MAKSFRELEALMSPAALARSDAEAAKLAGEMVLNELRQARATTQEELARRLNIKQATVSKLERRADMYVSTLRDVITALGGELEITARFPEGEVRIKQFDLDSAA